MVVIDATMLVLLLRPGAGAPRDAKGRPVQHAAERIRHLVKDLGKARSKILVPTPALSEALVRAGVDATQKIIATLNKHSVFRIEPFDTRAAIEVALMTRAALESGRSKRDALKAPWTKIKFDRQIVAIAKVNQATTIYSDDLNLRAIAKRSNIDVLGLADLALPPESEQNELPFPGFPDIEEQG